ncbi:serine hydrolase domain-containing protein [Agrilactobacillus composti]|nr:serine hydrolase domain-containing protein [Agrilactobacillus composti]
MMEVLQINKGKKCMKLSRKLLISLITGMVLGVIGSMIYYNMIIVPRNQATQDRIVAEKMAKNRAYYKRELAQQETKLATGNQSDPRVAKAVDKLTAAQRTKIEGLLNDSHFTGTALLYKKGQPVYQQGFGYADFSKKRKNDYNSLFQWASVQKSLTAVLLMKQVELGKVKLSDKLNRYYPAVQGSDQITLRQMLNMNSGLSMGVQQLTYANKDAKIVNFAVDHAIFQPNQLNQWQYAPVNYVLLAGVIEKITGKSYAALAKEQVFKPLGLKNTGFMPNFAKEPNRTVPYNSQKGNLDAYTQPINITPISYNRELGTGNIYSTAGDLLKFQQAVIDGQIIDKKSLATLRNTTGGNYGGGVYNYDKHIYSHGFVTGYEATVYLKKNGKSGLVLLSNRYLYNASSKKTRALTNNIYKALMAD